jgi:branched-chain amino acid transport system substrate-binding protein
MQRRVTAAPPAFAAMLALLGAARADEVIIGEQYPLSGPMAAFSGPFLKQGAEMAVERINKEQMLGPGRTLKLVIEDNAGDRNQAISLMSKLANTPGVVAIHGVYGSFLSLPAAPVANDLKIPFLATAVSTQIAAAGSWSFTQLPPAIVSMNTIGEFAINKHHIKKVAAIYDRSNDASVQLKEAFLKYVSARGATVVAQDSITAQETNFGPVTTKVANLDIDALFVEAVPSVVANLVIQLQQAGLDPKIKIYSSGQVSSPTFIKTAGAAAEGLYGSVDYMADDPNPENKIFVENYRKLYKDNPDQNASWGYAGVMILAAAIKNAEPGVDRAKLRDALAALRDVPVVSGSGKFSFDENRVAFYPSVVVQFRGDKFVQADD